ncbi:TonB-dependent siderophore receptor [Aliarcobacter butzleri]|uniref:TonB-dependent siderophore receptor n=1 Tax=Aliarcobacter butzleri TaxID=28197 RepID=UPI0021B27A06|nr:TonB-dependent receptor [Aliarcobacter butzleri]MCT7537307.1 TonB-dependent receptor [Aliarcobacter butzleri]MCT7623629.1 TonB-dependent receptor [Aliarcobacter butzleri]
MNFSKRIAISTSLSIILSSSLFAAEFNIESGTLENAIKTISKTSNMTYMVDARILDGKKVPKIENIEGVENALKEVLKGTNLEAVIKDNTIVIKKIEGKGTILDAISVNEGYLGSTNSYTVKETSSATKLDLSLKETPQSISIITQKQIEDQNLKDINDILLQTPGVTTIQYGQTGAGYTSYYSRGFKVSNYQRDGIPTTGFGDFVGLEDSAIYEKVEVIRGSTGLTNGTGNPSASINYVRKKPTRDFQGDAKISYGSWDTYKGQLDVSGGLNEDDSIRGRFVATYSDGENQQDRYNKENSLIYGALDFDLSDNTLLTTALTYQKTNIDNATPHGFPFITTDGKKQTTFDRYDNPAADYTYSDTEKLNLSAGLEHYFNDDWKSVVNYSYTKAKNDRVYGVAGSGGIWYNTGLMRVTSGRFESTPETHAIDLYTTGNIKAFEKEHKLSFGVNGYQTKSDDPSYKRVFDNVSISGWNGHVNNPSPIVKNGKTVVDIKEIGAFAALNLELSDPLHLIVGSRITNFERINNKGTSTEQEQKYNAEVIPYLGLVYDINENFATYASYTSIFNPTSTNKDISGNYLDPEEGNTVEFGLKSEFYDGKLNSSIAYFITKQDNLAVTDGSNLTPEGSQAYKSVDGAKIKGWDLTIGGEILPNWDITGGYTYTNAKDQDNNPLNTDIPKHTFKIFNTYQINKLTLGAGVNWQSKIYNSSSTGLAKDLSTQKAYAVVNAMAKYDIKKDFSVTLNANNIFDEEYVLNTSNGAWGAERNYTLSLNYKF